MERTSRTSKQLKKLQTNLTELALEVTANFGIKLDFSIESVKQVEDILSQIHHEFNESKNDEGMSGIALEFAAYIISVIERNIATGKWQRDSKEMGKDTFPYQITNDHIIFPYAWCLKRIIDGESENVWIKFNSLVLEK
jgi:hypothetical protein